MTVIDDPDDDTVQAGESPPPAARVDERKALLAGYIATYNSLDTLCWSIPTRVYAGTFVVLALLADKVAEPIDLAGASVALVVLAFVNLMGAASLKRLWFDHSRMGYWIACIEQSLDAGIGTGDQWNGDVGQRSGYFGHRHRETHDRYDDWRKAVDAGGPFGKAKRKSTRGINVLFMQVTGGLFLLVAVGAATLIAVAAVDPAASRVLARLLGNG